MKENRPEQAGIGLSMLRVAFRSRQASHRLLRIRFASMTQFDGMSSEHHPKRNCRIEELLFLMCWIVPIVM
ncbi:hypothetical protein [Ralstonia pseudosolanacearum]|uniref:hypothetical protein n=1 Tax=Ralstonia pseudosolanacearum TaxID=1310165 RepID=UPI0030CA894F